MFFSKWIFTEHCLRVWPCTELGVWEVREFCRSNLYLGVKQFTLPGLQEFETWSLRAGNFDPFCPVLGSVAGVTMITLTFPPTDSLFSGADRSIPR